MKLNRLAGLQQNAMMQASQLQGQSSSLLGGALGNIGGALGAVQGQLQYQQYLNR